MNATSAKRVLSALQAELKRSMEQLKAPGHPRPYFISYLVRDIQRYEVWARYGAVCQDQLHHKRNCFNDIRVGSYRFDQVGSGGLTDNSEESDSYDLTDLPLDDNIDAIRFCIWRLTDAKYREAVARYHGRKSRNVSYLDENRNLPSFQKMRGEQSRTTLKRFSVDQEYWRDYVKKASLVFKQFANIKNSYCEFQAEMITKIFVSSEGVVRIWQQPLYHLSAYVWFHTKKTNQDANHVCQVSRIDELPSLSEFKRQIKHLAETMEQLDQGEEMSSYNGPVLLAARPAGLFLHEVVGHRLEGNRLLSDREGRTFKDKRNQKIMHEDLTIFDDPTRRAFEGQSLAGAYDFDDEGVTAQPVLLVERGVLRSFLTTRMPIHSRHHQSNGHARNQSHERPISRMGNLIIESHSKLSWQDLKNMLIEEVKKRKLKFGLVLLEVQGGETETEAYDFQAFLGEITLAAKIYPNGREVFVRGVDFVGTPLSSLSNIIAVGSEYAVDNSYCGAESGTISVSTVSPPMLLSNLELQVKDPSKVTQYALSLPWIKSKK